MQAEERHNCDAQDLPESVLVVQNQSGVGAQPDQCREEKGCAHDDPLPRNQNQKALRVIDAEQADQVFALLPFPFAFSAAPR